MKTRSLLLILAVAATASVQATPVTISQWTFELSAPTTAGPISPETGSGEATAVGTAGYSNPVGNGSAESWSAISWSVGDYWQFRVSASGYENIELSWDQTGSGSGPRDFDLKYSTDGTTFSVFASYTVRNNASPAWVSTTSSSLYSYTCDLSSIAALNNAVAVYFRLVDASTTSANGGTVGSSGTDRVDNFTVSGTVIPSGVPDPPPGLASWACLLGLLALTRWFPRIRSTADARSVW